jgi:hypothetical protein
MAELFVGGVVDPGEHKRTGDDVKLKSEDVTTHGVIVGMTGSGKTGLGVVLIEEVLAAGIPAVLIDPKADLTNLCLMFPWLSAEEFRPWIDEAQAKAAGVTADEFAAQQATTWKDGLAGWGYGSAQISALRAKCDLTIYTPGSQSGVPVSIVGSLQVPGTDDPEIVGDEIEGFVSGLLGLVGIDADPLSSREHILLANLIQHSWSTGTALDLPTLVGMVQQPPVRKLGVFELDQFFPPDDRTKLAIKLNGLLASPAFAAWGAGQPLDIQSLLYGPDGAARGAIITTAHLSDEERQFVTSLVLSKLVTWMRRQSGTTDLRALLYMDEVAGYLPPTANPPTKKADHDADEAGAGVRRRRRAGDPEPRRRRLQGAVQRGHVDGRPAADRSRQAAAPRRDERGVRRSGRERRRGHDQRTRQARVRPATGRQGPAGGVHQPLGDELPARTTDPRSDQDADGWRRTARGGRGDDGGGGRRHARRRHHAGDAQGGGRRSRPLGRPGGRLARRRRWRCDGHRR